MSKSKRLKSILSRASSRFIHNKQGIVVLWGLIFIAMAVYLLCWFTVGLPLVYFINAVRVNMISSLDAYGVAVIDFVMFALEIHPVIALFGWFIYGIMHSAKKETDLYRV